MLSKNAENIFFFHEEIAQSDLQTDSSSAISHLLIKFNIRFITVKYLNYPKFATLWVTTTTRTDEDSAADVIFDLSHNDNHPREFAKLQRHIKSYIEAQFMSLQIKCTFCEYFGTGNSVHMKN